MNSKKIVDSKQKLKIAILHFGFFYAGGGERLVLEEVRGLRKLGHNVECFAPVVEISKCYPEIMKEVKVRALLPQLPSWFPDREAIQILASSALMPFLAFRFGRFDVILGANQPGPWMAWIINKVLGKPYIAYLAQPTRVLHPRRVDLQTGFWLKKRLRVLPYIMKIAKPFIKWADEISIKGSYRILTNGDYISRAIKKSYLITNTVCAAGANPAKKSELKVDKWDGKIIIKNFLINKPFILITNRHFPQKRFEYAISAMPMILSAVPQASLIITGEETDYTKYLKGVVSQLELENKIHFVGLVSEKDLKTLYLNAACYVYTSPEEDFGMGVVEAMAHGTVPVAWRKGGPRYIIRGGETGFLAKPYQISDLARQIIRCLMEEDLSRKIGRQAWQEVKEKYTHEAHVKILEKHLYI